jgi:hypothetical protein
MNKSTWTEHRGKPVTTMSQHDTYREAAREADRRHEMRGRDAMSGVDYTVVVNPGTTGPHFVVQFYNW